MSEYRLVNLPTATGDLRIPSNMIVEMEDDETLMFYPPGQEMITLRISCLVPGPKKGVDNPAFDVCLSIAKKRGQDVQILGDKCITFDRQDTEQDGEQLEFMQWDIACRNVDVILTATVIERHADQPVVKETLASIPAMIESIRIR